MKLNIHTELTVRGRAPELLPSRANRSAICSKSEPQSMDLPNSAASLSLPNTKSA